MRAKYASIGKSSFPVRAGASLVECCTFPTALMVPDGAIDIANAAFWTLIDAQPRSSMPSLEEFIGSEHRAEFLTACLRALAGDTPVLAEVTIRRERGGPVWVRVSLALCESEAGHPRLFVQTAELDSDQLASVERLRFAVEGAGQGVWDHDLVRGTAYYSPNWYRMRGFPDGCDVDEKLGHWLDRLHPDDRPRIEGKIAQQDSGELVQNAFEYRERHRNGEWIWVLSRGKPVAWNPDGSVARIVGTDTDITALKSAESRLAEETERLRITLHSIADGMISTDSIGRITFLNPAAVGLTGWSLEEAMGRDIGEVYCPMSFGEPGARANVVARCLLTGHPHTSDEDLVLVSRSGADCDIHHTASPVRAPDGTVIGAVLVFQDITNRQNQKRKHPVRTAM